MAQRTLPLDAHSPRPTLTFRTPSSVHENSQEPLKPAVYVKQNQSKHAQAHPGTGIASREQNQERLTGGGQRHSCQFLMNAACGDDGQQPPAVPRCPQKNGRSYLLFGQVASPNPLPADGCATAIVAVGFVLPCATPNRRRSLNPGFVALSVHQCNADHPKTNTITK